MQIVGTLYPFTGTRWIWEKNCCCLAKAIVWISIYLYMILPRLLESCINCDEYANDWKYKWNRKNASSEMREY